MLPVLAMDLGLNVMRNRKELKHNMKFTMVESWLNVSAQPFALKGNTKSAPGSDSSEKCPAAITCSIMNIWERHKNGGSTCRPPKGWDILYLMNLAAWSMISKWRPSSMWTMEELGDDNTQQIVWPSAINKVRAFIQHLSISVICLVVRKTRVGSVSVENDPTKSSKVTPSIFDAENSNSMLSKLIDTSYEKTYYSLQ